MWLLLLLCVCCFSNGSLTWMNDDWEEIKGLKITQLAIPGTHDSGTFDLSLFAAPNMKDAKLIRELDEIGVDLPAEIIRNWATSQGSNFSQQLIHGARYFDIRTTMSDGVFHTYHYLLSLVRIEELLEQISSFLNNTSRECLVLDFSHFDNIQNIDLLYQMIISKIGYALFPKSSEFPSLSYMVEQGKRVIAMLEDPGDMHMFWERRIISHWADTPDLNVLVSDQKAFLESSPQASSLQLFRKLQWVLTENVDLVLKALLDIFFHPRTLLELSFECNVELFNFTVNNQRQLLNIVMVDNLEASPVLDVCRNLNTMQSCTDLNSTRCFEKKNCDQDPDHQCMRSCGYCDMKQDLPGFRCNVSTNTCNCVKGVCLSRVPKSLGSCVNNFQCKSGVCKNRRCS